ncbi:spermidine synthase [Paenibacillus swuensis]|uniref:Spermidine synthase n=1 Tax=Paenibacillus swuensis TaxID=1178515 RepID=A0A172TF25_9BACL|nr:fused MFS/spermidine synthase [Paenibacillus swuensis]ANE45665.1 spermidine synthase [Paenibacillus swuensis]
MRLLAKEFDNHHEILVYETNELYGERGNFRVLQFSGDAVQGALDLNHPERIVFEYPRAMIHLMEHNHPSFERVFVIGHGIGTLARHYSEKHFKIAELNETVVALSRQYFEYNKDDVVIGDGRQLLSQEAASVYDVIILDAFTDQGTPRHLTSKEFFNMAKEKMDEEGMVLLNLIGKGEGDRLIHAIHTTVGAVFAYTKRFVLPADGKRDVINTLIVGRNQPIEHQTRQMAGFMETGSVAGHVIWD